MATMVDAPYVNHIPTMTGGVGHDLPQEAPKAFAQSIIDVDHA